MIKTGIPAKKGRFLVGFKLLKFKLITPKTELCIERESYGVLRWDRWFLPGIWKWDQKVPVGKQRSDRPHSSISTLRCWDDRSVDAFYCLYVVPHLGDLFPDLLSYNRFVELKQKVALHFMLFLKNRGLVRDYLVISVSWCRPMQKSGRSQKTNASDDL